jgi:hypothetical protein
MYLNTFIGGNVCATAKQAQERGGGQGLLVTADSTVAPMFPNLPAVRVDLGTADATVAKGRTMSQLIRQ